MTDVIRCPHCGQQYNPSPAVVGKRIRCRSCGQVFVALPNSQADSQVNLDALAALKETQESAAHFSRAGDDQGIEVRNEQSYITVGKLNTRYGFTGSRELDAAFPWLILASLGLWLTVELTRTNTSQVGWIGASRVLFLVLVFSIVMFPIAMMSTKYTARAARFQMPRDWRKRVFAGFFGGFALVGVIWSIGGGTVMSLLLGAVAGCVLTSVCMVVLMRSRSEEAGLVAGISAGALAFGVMAASAITFVMNLAASRAVELAGLTTSVPQSPIATHMDWSKAVAPELENNLSRPKLTQKIVTTTAPVPVNPAATMGPSLASTPVSTPVQVITRVPDGAKLIWPLEPAEFVALARKSSETALFEIVSLVDGTTKQKVELPAAAFDSQVALSPDGSRLVRLMEFPRRQIQVIDTSTGKPLGTIPLVDGAAPVILGIGAKQLLAVRRGETDAVVQVFDLCRATLVSTISLANQVAGSPLVFDRQGGQLAFFTRTEGPTVASSGVSQQLIIADLSTGQRTAALPITTATATPTGIGFSPDGARVALTFEQAGEGVIVAFDLPTSSKLGEFLVTMPSGTNSSPDSVLVFVDSDRVLLRGRDLIELAGGTVVGKQVGAPPTWLRFQGGDMLTLREGAILRHRDWQAR